jgi:hypothetical protein
MDFQILVFTGRSGKLRPMKWPGAVGWLVAIFFFLTLTGFAEDSSLASNAAPALELKLDDYLHLVAEQNETLQAQLLEVEAARFKARGEWGIMEPVASASVLREGNKRQNDVQQQAAQSGQPVFSERDTIYDTARETRSFSSLPLAADALGENLDCCSRTAENNFGLRPSKPGG